ncbi:MAG: YbjN domain-containing protein [Leptolyngbyaceae cyanobacterium bins.59]|nr:YbjN domain-containing protein [Leptolyngbyaceae cyanobacterium bins.59]
MQFETEAQQTCFEKIKPWTLDYFETAFVPDYGIPAIVVPMGSAAAMVEVFPWGERDTIIRTWAYVVTQADLTPELLRFLLQKNVEMNFGAFGIDGAGDIRLEHAIVGSTCDSNELQSSLVGVLTAADRYDDEIVSRWGGKRAIDRYLAMG